VLCARQYPAMTTYRGHCFCGAIGFEVEGPELYACFCHCESCRRASGAATVPWATFTRGNFRVTFGNMARRHSSAGVTRGLCSNCGTSLTYEHSDRKDQIDVTLASFEDPSVISPRAHIWVEDKLPWVVIGDDLPQYSRTAAQDVPDD
jgi:hypothetical protein